MLRIGMLTALGTGPVRGESVSLAWDPNAEPDVVGYKLYYGSPLGSFGQIQDVGSVSNVTVTALLAGSTYAFRVTCHNSTTSRSGLGR